MDLYIIYLYIITCILNKNMQKKTQKESTKCRVMTLFMNYRCLLSVLGKETGKQQVEHRKSRAGNKEYIWSSNKT